MEKVGSQQLCLLHSTWCLNWTVSALRFGKLPFAEALWNGSYGPNPTLPRTQHLTKALWERDRTLKSSKTHTSARYRQNATSS